jgi:hypothetical protein
VLPTAKEQNICTKYYWFKIFQSVKTLNVSLKVSNWINKMLTLLSQEPYRATYNSEGSIKKRVIFIFNCTNEIVLGK